MSSPASAGPAIVASWKSEVLSATALPKSWGGTRLGSSDWLVGMLKARAMPKTAMAAKIGSVEVTSARLSSTSASAAPAPIR